MVPERLSLAEARHLLRDADLEAGEWKTLRRRVEDCLRKSPAALLEVAALSVVEGWIRIDDLI